MEKQFHYLSQWDSRETETPPKYLEQLQSVNQMKYDLFTIMSCYMERSASSRHLYDSEKLFTDDSFVQYGRIFCTWAYLAMELVYFCLAKVICHFDRVFS